MSKWNWGKDETNTLKMTKTEAKTYNVKKNLALVVWLVAVMMLLLWWLPFSEA